MTAMEMETELESVVDTPVTIVDAFTGDGFAGNPAAVCPRDTWLPDDVMQAIARELALSETAFFVPQDGGYALRWFTPATEVDLCGHATLASAAVVLGKLDPTRGQVRFHTRKAGTLTVVRRDDMLEMDFPANPAKSAPVNGIADALGATPAETLLQPGQRCLAVFDSEDQVRALRPDMDWVAALDPRMVIATAPGKAGDFASRCFAPRAGIPEDPVTGSAHTTLAPYWAKRLGKQTLHAHQVSERGGELFCEVRGARVAMAGRATMRASGSVIVRGDTIEAQLSDP